MKIELIRNKKRGIYLKRKRGIRGIKDARRGVSIFPEVHALSQNPVEIIEKDDGVVTPYTEEASG